MQSNVRRAAAFALVGTVAIVAPVAGALTAVPFALIAVAARMVSHGRVFELFARPTDRVDGELRGLVGFTLAATALALLTSLADLPADAFVATVFLAGYGNFTEQVLCQRRDSDLRRAVGFAGGGSVAAIGGQVAGNALSGVTVDLPFAVFLAVTGALVAALLRAVLAGRDDPLVMVTVAGLLWVFVAFGIDVGAVDLVLAIVIACGFGYTSWLLGTASITGMLAGIISGLITIVLGGLGWFVILIVFFGLGGFASQYRYEEKRDLGVAEANEGARGSGNVLGNAAVALIAVVGFATAEDLGVAKLAFEFVFAGSLATAMSDTFSSELGVLLGEPRLITNLETVPPGTDGGVTLLGSLIGAGGAAVVAVLSVVLLDIGPLGGLIVIVAGTVGMLVDSLLGATLEQRWIGNQGVNLGATSSGAVVGVVMAVGLGFV